MERYVILQDINDPTKIINTYEDWGLILGNIDNPLPIPKTDFVDNPGGNGTIDNTESLNEIKYNDRPLKLPFTMKDKFNDIEKAKSKIANFVHGKRFKIILYKDLDYYYIGRLSMEDFSINRATGTFSLVGTCKPYKYKKDITSYIYTVNNNKTIIIKNERKYVVPKITTSSAMIINFEGHDYFLSEGTHEVLNIYLKEGDNTLIVTGTGTLKIEYQEASL